MTRRDTAGEVIRAAEALQSAAEGLRLFLDNEATGRCNSCGVRYDSDELLDHVRPVRQAITAMRTALLDHDVLGSAGKDGVA